MLFQAEAEAAADCLMQLLASEDGKISQKSFADFLKARVIKTGMLRVHLSIYIYIYIDIAFFHHSKEKQVKFSSSLDTNDTF